MLPNAGHSRFLSALKAALPAGGVVADPDVMDAYRRDASEWATPGEPAAVALPSSTEEVAAAVRVADEYTIPIVARGAGTGLSGGATATDGCLVLCLTKMDHILEIDVANQLAVVQPGVINGDLRRAVAAVGLAYLPDPSSYESSTIGGNMATNAGGLCCVKYGVTGDFVLGLEVVLADASIVRLGRRTMKGVAGYDLSRLFVGSEGTLGIITEATLRLRPSSFAPATVVAFFPTLISAGQAVVDIMAGPTPPSLLELMDATTVAAVEEWKCMDLDTTAAALLVGQSDAGPGRAAAEVAYMEQACLAAGATFAAETADPDEGEQLLAARRLAYPALQRLGVALLDDVAVPRSAIPQLLAGVEQISAHQDVVIGTFGHAGDGNMHPTVIFDRTVTGSEEAAERAFDDIVRLALTLGGTITGEHGVGTLKARYLRQELSPAALALHARVKQAFDPKGLLNPGKVLGP